MKKIMLFSNKELEELKAPLFIQNIKDWTKISDRVYIWDYAVNFANYLQPFPVFYQLEKNIKKVTLYICVTFLLLNIISFCNQQFFV